MTHKQWALHLTKQYFKLFDGIDEISEIVDKYDMWIPEDKESEIALGTKEHYDLFDDALIEKFNRSLEGIIQARSVGATITYNVAKNGIELCFDKEPSAEIIRKLEADAFRRSKSTSVIMWYIPDSSFNRHKAGRYGSLPAEG